MLTVFGTRNRCSKWFIIFSLSFFRFPSALTLEHFFEHHTRTWNWIKSRIIGLSAPEASHTITLNLYSSVTIPLRSGANGIPAGEGWRCRHHWLRDDSWYYAKGSQLNSAFCQLTDSCSEHSLPLPDLAGIARRCQRVPRHLRQAHQSFAMCQVISLTRFYSSFSCFCLTHYFFHQKTNTRALQFRFQLNFSLP